MNLWHLIAGLIGAAVSHLLVRVRSWQDALLRAGVGTVVAWGLTQAF